MISKALVVTAASTATAVFSACSAHADSLQFPNLSAYTPANVTDYRVDASTPGISATQVFFLTPDGVICSFLSGQAQCTGNNLPGIPPASLHPTSRSA